MKTSNLGRIVADRYLIKTEYQDSQLDELGDKDYFRPTIIEQAKMSYDGRQRIENPNFTSIPSGYFQGKAYLHTGAIHKQCQSTQYL